MVGDVLRATTPLVNGELRGLIELALQILNVTDASDRVARRNRLVDPLPDNAFDHRDDGFYQLEEGLDLDAMSAQLLALHVPPRAVSIWSGGPLKIGSTE